MKKQICILAASAILVSASGTAALSGDKAYADDAVEAMQNYGILVGDENGDLYLSGVVTRAEFAKLLYEVMEAEGKELPESANALVGISDVGEDHWAYKYISALCGAGMINGYEDGTFRPEEPILLEEAAKITAVAAGAVGYTDSYPLGYIAAAMDDGLLFGVEALSGDMITREDAVNMAYNLKNFISLDMEIEEHEASGPLFYGSSGGYATASSGGGGSAAAATSGSYYDMYAPFNTEEYTQNDENIFKNALTSPLSTFSIDVDTASYSNVRRYILRGQLPPAGSVRTEEFINYFDYDYPAPEEGEAFSVYSEVARCPWNQDNLLAMIAIKGEEIAPEEREPSNLVFLIDVSGSMTSANKLPLVKKSLDMLLDNLDERDTISVVTYANGTEIVLDSVSASNKEEIRDAIFSLDAYGGTGGYDGITQAYELAEKNYKDGNNRIILCTDGDFNIGPSSTEELEELVTEKREKGIFVSVLGFGMGNYKDNRMEILADKGNGNYAYIDNLQEAKKVLADEMIKTLYTIAKDVKIQVEFNPAHTSEYRLIGYENRLLNAEDFDNDAKDAGEFGAGATVTAFYEIVPADGSESAEFRYREINAIPSDELMYLKLRYKEPNGEESKLIEVPIGAEVVEEASDNFRFASAVAEFGMILNDSEYKGTSTTKDVIERARSGMGEDEFGLKHEFVRLVDLIQYAK